ncbi:hypothetical protein PHMEG_00031299 [Phytophthora megakarya]|uniref:Uncharacterized protein n=1 Tax=Phytophthora megakarya TaxID=4795 RepID=A0A225V0S4_9STRA|nr:hypothetical protein PHMEG_00031299 [Phytophthora megakarya]
MAAATRRRSDGDIWSAKCDDGRGGRECELWKQPLSPLENEPIYEEGAGSELTAEEGAVEVSVTEEGSATTGMVGRPVDEVLDELAAVELGTELPDATVTKLGSVAKVRVAVKQARREAKRQRVRRARDRCVRVNGKTRVDLVRYSSTTADTDVDVVTSVEASDGLPTAAMLVKGETQQIKVDGGFLLDVLGVWTFDMINVYGQKETIDACIIDGCTSEFLIGVDVLEKHRATVDFDRSEVRYDERGREVIIPFRTNEGDNSSAMATRALHASAVTKVKNRRAIVPAINTHGGRIRLPSRLRVESWLNNLGDTTELLEDESKVNVGMDEPDARELILNLLHAYSSLTGAQDEATM